MFGATPMAEGLRAVSERFASERSSQTWFPQAVLFFLSDGEPDDASPVPALAKELKAANVVVVSCYVTSADIAKPRTLYAAKQDNWPAGARLMFDCASVLEEGSTFFAFARERGWQAPAGARLFAQVNQSEVLQEFLQFALSPVEGAAGGPELSANHDRRTPAGGLDAARVFISYAHDSEAHCLRVRSLAARLRTDGVNCTIDRYVSGSPPEGWPLWMERQIGSSDFVLVVGSDRYIRRYEGVEEQAVGLGATWEAVLTRVELYEAQGINKKFVPVVFDGNPREIIPKPLRSQSYYRVPDDYEKLLRVLTSQPAIVPPPIGDKRHLPPDPL
jgi:hypothetical protein